MPRRRASDPTPQGEELVLWPASLGCSPISGPRGPHSCRLVIEQGRWTLPFGMQKIKSLNRVLGRRKIQTWPGQRGLSPGNKTPGGGLSLPLHPQHATQPAQANLQQSEHGVSGERRRQRATKTDPQHRWGHPPMVTGSKATAT